jgi:putative transposase
MGDYHFFQKFLIEKINYIHYNPVTGKWQLAKNFVEYEHSSASFYEIQLVKHFRPAHYIDL